MRMALQAEASKNQGPQREGAGVEIVQAILGPHTELLSLSVAVALAQELL